MIREQLQREQASLAVDRERQHMSEQLAREAAAARTRRWRTGWARSPHKIRGNVVLPPDITGQPGGASSMSCNCRPAKCSQVKLRKSSGHRALRRSGRARDPEIVAVAQARQGGTVQPRAFELDVPAARLKYNQRDEETHALLAAFLLLLRRHRRARSSPSKSPARAASASRSPSRRSPARARWRRASAPSCAPTWRGAACSARWRSRRSIRRSPKRRAVNFAEWRARLADALVLGSVAARPDGRFEVRFRLFDTVKGADLSGVAYTLSREQVRTTAHRIADFIYEKLTGEKGVFSTRIAYVVKRGNRYELQIADADGAGEETALASREPIISPAWSPDGAAPRLRVVREQEAGGVRALAGRRQAPGGGEFQGLELRAGLVARRQAAGGVAVARRRLADLPRQRRRQRRAPPDAIGRHRHRAVVLPGRPVDLLHLRPRRQPADLPHARRRRRGAARDLRRAATTSRRASAPTARRSPTSRATAASSRWRRWTWRAGRCRSSPTATRTNRPASRPTAA